MKELSHPDYKIPGTNLVSFSRWSRENIPKPPHGIPIGSVVEFNVSLDGPFNIERVAEKEITLGFEGRGRLIVVGYHEDCDGTALYQLADQPIAPPDNFGVMMTYRAFVTIYLHGYSEDNLWPTGDRVEVEPWERFKAKMLGYTNLRSA